MAFSLARRVTNAAGRSPGCAVSSTPGAAQTKGNPNLCSSSRRYLEVDARISSGGDFKNKDLHRIRFDRGGNGPYYTRPMAAGLPDQVDCAHLADDGALLQLVYELSELPRLRDLLADTRGAVSATVAFESVAAGRAGATVSVEAKPNLLCQRCLQGFSFPVAGKSEIEFAGSEDAAPMEPQREIYVTERGRINLRELVEEELLLAFPVAAACSTPQTCGKAPALEGERSRPFAGLKDLLKKT